MIISEIVKVPANSKIKTHYLNMGYIIDSGVFYIKTEDLLPNSRIIVKCKCDYCDYICETPYFLYLKNISHNNKFSCSNKCGSKKRKELSMLKYGVISPSKLEIVKEKTKATNLEKYDSEFYLSSCDFKKKSKKTIIEKYGVDNVMRVQEIKEKIKQTNLEKYGTENVFESELIKEKIKQINLEKYGFSYYSQTDEYKNKFKKTMFEKWGVEYASQSEEIKEKIKQTNLKRFGVDHPMKLNSIKEKTQNTNIEKYGVKYPSMLDEIKEKVKSTNLLKLGVEYPMQSDLVKKKSIETNLKNHGVEQISQSETLRKSIFKMCKDSNYIGYNTNKKMSIYYCDTCDNTFLINSDNYISRKKLNIKICTICNPIGELRSFKEKELFDFIFENYKGEIIKNYRDVLEIDVYLPELKIGFEFNGLYYHSDKFKNKNYHYDKTLYFKDKGIRLIHIWEDDWVYKNNIIKSQIINWIGITNNKIYARKCYIKEIDLKSTRVFLNENHIQGYSNSKVKIGLFYNNEMMCVMTFDKYEGRKKMNEGEWNLSRFCNKLNANIIGGASKLLKYFINNYYPNRIVSYADASWSNGNLYEKLGFHRLYEIPPDYKYIVDDKRIHKSNFKKSEIFKKIKINMDNKTENQLIVFLNINKIWDIGKYKYEFLKTE
jgi:hypothetical protein